MASRFLFELFGKRCHAKIDLKFVGLIYEKNIVRQKNQRRLAGINKTGRISKQVISPNGQDLFQPLSVGADIITFMIFFLSQPIQNVFFVFLIGFLILKKVL